MSFEGKSFLYLENAALEELYTELDGDDVTQNVASLLTSVLLK
jgi:hypothetical protein